MKSANLFPLGLLTLALATTFLFSCKKETNPVTAFLNCNDNCTEAALEVKDAYLKDPQPVLFAFAWKGNEENEAKFVQWLGILRDSFFFNQEGTGLTGMQLAEIKAQMLASAETFINDSNLAPVANRFIAEIGPLVIVGQVDVPGNAYTGTFAYELPNEAGSGELKLAPAGDSSVRFSLLVVAGPPAYN